MVETAANQHVPYEMRDFKNDYRETQNKLQSIDEKQINPQDLGLIIS